MDTNAAPIESNRTPKSASCTDGSYMSLPYRA